ncbi:hypothetical protein OIU84_006683 [Salix udensis]|uniref:Uncharacterized protein n=1 Tax=Salix udensis TaxID=889485 RepID=A0AAD6JZ95_9ROSI|nr:hypothetical protein OIU84_006683 [Salix udensis]
MYLCIIDILYDDLSVMPNLLRRPDESSSSATDSSVETQLKPSDVRNVKYMEDHVRTLPLESLLCTTSKQMSLPSSPDTGSTSRAPTTGLSSALSATPLVTNDDRESTLVTRKKKKKKNEIITTRAPHTFTTQRKFMGPW